MFGAQPLKIALGDLRHETAGRHSVFMPIGIAYIASYLASHLDDGNVEVRLYDRPVEILKDIEQWKPTIVGLSNYCWNSELSRRMFDYAKEVNPDTVCIAGGPEFPSVLSDCKEYLLRRKAIDFYVYREGEVAFTKLIRKLAEGIVAFELKSEPQVGIMSIHPRTGDLVAGKPAPRLTNLDEIPSPYLNSLLERWFDGHYAPSIETTRGCPFSCGYCHTGLEWYNTIARFSVERIKAELSYIACRMTDYSDVFLAIFDANFGMYEQDEEVANHLARLRDDFGWPNSFNVSGVAKANHDRLMRISSVLNNKIPICSSVQSLNSETLKAIKRKNLPTDKYIEIHNEILRRGMHSICELIVPLPEETKASFFEGVKAVTNAGVKDVFAYTTMVLKGTYLDSQECREKYKMQTKFRLVPRQFGEYMGRKCFEIEEVCVATDSLSFEDYLDCRGLALVLSLLSHEQFDLISRHLVELGISRYEHLYYIWKLISYGRTELSKIYNEYLDETRKELWDNKESVYEYFTERENYEKLLTGDLGDNLVRKYRTKLLLECCVPAIKIAYSAIRAVAGESITREVQKSLEAAERWTISVRNVSFLRDGPLTDNVETLHLPYDVYGWYLSGSDSSPLVSYNTATDYKVFYSLVEIERLLDEGEKMFGRDISYRFGKAIIHWSIKKFWRKCEPVVKEGSIC
ncbi:MAG: cobalamin-dependent protein [Sedimentisphaerales bacterium]